jgi:hypothetical protein
MRFIVLLLGLLAVGKVGYQEYLFRTKRKETVVAAYRDRAAQVCQRDAKSASFDVRVDSWLKSRDINLRIGNREVDVMPWQVDSQRWAARYRNPNLWMSIPAGAGTLACSYDVVTGIAVVARI